MLLMTHIAFNLAMRAHEGQVDKAGFPYWTHLARVAKDAADHARLTGSRSIVDYVTQAAWLHDVLEDTDTTEAELRNQFDPLVVNAVVLLTKTPGEPNANYYERIRNNSIVAKIVKIADVRDNSDPRRLVYLDEATQLRLIKKYAKALEALDKAW